MATTEQAPAGFEKYYVPESLRVSAVRATIGLILATVFGAGPRCSTT